MIARLLKCVICKEVVWQRTANMHRFTQGHRTHIAPASSHHLTPGWLNGRAIHATGVPHSEQRSPRELVLSHKLHFLHN